MSIFCRTSKMSHDGSWRDSCASTRRDRSRRWLWRLVGPFSRKPPLRERKVDKRIHLFPAPVGFANEDFTRARIHNEERPGPPILATRRKQINADGPHFATDLSARC